MTEWLHGLEDWKQFILGSIFTIAALLPLWFIVGEYNKMAKEKKDERKAIQQKQRRR